ncbi:DHHA1 domain-containing protein [Anoxybacillus rupiensis]|uniref:DHHA1 domain-containing protein n=1 Tax=Anoxybacteroides rupiense TaxID=311460 RepID=A0ABT5W493_9BACL|nr:DHHA1 domain-containing protein [Anoxybacillus rupiensis]MDE8564136.1 DHHA1 domain-containing protein [Anoxybacillus rupiensis]
MMKLFTDSDLDGVGCGLLATLAFGSEVDVSYCSYRNLNERVRSFLENRQHDSAFVWITDLAVNHEIEEMLDHRFKTGKHVQMIDHHITALHFNRHPWGWVVPVDECGKKTCATSLFYEYLIREQRLERKEILDEFVELVRQYDTWEWDENNNVQAKHLNDLLSMLGIDEFVRQMLERLQKESSFAFTDLEAFVLQIEEKKIQRYIRLKQKQIVQTWIEGRCVGIVFAEQYISELGNALSKRLPHLDMIAMVNPGTKHIGFRTTHDEVNVAEFAQRFGGGGHPKASGCSADADAFLRFAAPAFQLPPVYLDAEQNRFNQKEHVAGIFFKNHQDQWLLAAFCDEQKKWKVWGAALVPAVSFSTFEEAERWMKRSFAAGIADDALVIDYLCQQLSWSKDEVMARYTEAVEQYKKQQNGE